MFGYLDAATGSMIVAAISGGVAGVTILLRMYWHRFLGLFSKSQRKAADADAEKLLGKVETTES